MSGGVIFEVSGVKKTPLAKNVSDMLKRMTIQA